MNAELLKLAQSLCRRGSTASDDALIMQHHELEAFYRAAFNAGVEAAATACENIDNPDACDVFNAADEIRKLEIKP